MTDPNCTVPDRPLGDSTNATANTKFVQAAITAAAPALPHTHIFVGNSINAAADFGTLATFADTGGFTLAPSSGVPLTITGAAGLASALAITQTFSGTDTVNHQLNNIAITDTADLGANVGNGLNIAHSYGGSTAKGSRQAFQAGVTLTSPTNAANAAHFYVAAAFNAQANSGDGGTNTGAGSKGSIIGENPVATLGAGATNISELYAIQAQISVAVGATTRSRVGLVINDISAAGSSRGAVFDDAIQLTNTGSAPGWLIGLSFDAANNGAPLATTGTAIATVGSQTMGTFIDASSATVTSLFLNGPGGNFQVDGAGNTVSAANISAGVSNLFKWTGRSAMQSQSDGTILFTNAAQNNFTRLQLGGTTASFPAIKRTAASLNFRLADDSADAAITAASLTTSGAIVINIAAAGLNLLNSASATYNALNSGAGGHYTILAAPSGVTFFQARDADNGAGDANFGYLNNDTLQITNRANNSNFATFTSSGLLMQAGNVTMGVATKTLVLKQGANGTVGTFVANGAAAVTVSNTNVAISDAIIISLNTVGGTVGALPAIKTITASTGFTVAATAADTSTYNYAIIKNAA